MWVLGELPRATILLVQRVGLQGRGGAGGVTPDHARAVGAPHSQGFGTRGEQIGAASDGCAGRIGRLDGQLQVVAVN